MLPLLLLVIFGLIDFGRLLNAQITVTEAAREAARAKSLDVPNPESRAEQLTADLPDPTQISVGGCVTPMDTTENATATVVNEFTFVTPIGTMAGIVLGSPDNPLLVTGRGVMPCVY